MDINHPLWISGETGLSHHACLSRMKHSTSLIEDYTTLNPTHLQRKPKPWPPQGLGSVWSASLTNHHQPSSFLYDSNRNGLSEALKSTRLSLPQSEMRERSDVKCATVIVWNMTLSSYDFNIKCARTKKMGTCRKQYNNYILPAYMPWWVYGWWRAVYH